MDLYDILNVDDYAASTIAFLAERIAQSTSEEQLVYRETELDELWRLIDIAIKHATSEDLAALIALRTAVVEAHDLVGIDCAPMPAAQRLRAGIEAWQKSGNA